MSLPYAVQPHGCLIVLDDTLDQVLQVSANCWDFLSHSVDAATQMSASQLLGSSLTERLKRLLAGVQRLPGALLVRRQVSGARREYHLEAYRTSGRVLIELETASGKIGSRLLSALNEHLIEITSADHHDQLFQTLVDRFQALTGHSQVYLIRFLADGTGHVLAESDTTAERSFLGCRYPSTAFPPAVRARLRVNPLRSVPDISSTSVPILPAEPASDVGIDLAPGMLQATSENDYDYLKSLGVTGFLGAALYSDESLWGLVVGHHTEPFNQPPARRNAARALVQAATQRLFLLDSRESINFTTRVNESRIPLSGTLEEAANASSLLSVYGERWMEVFQADGIGLVLDTDISLLGVTLSAPDTQTLLRGLKEQLISRAVWDTHSLPTVEGMVEMAHNSGVYGVLVAALPSSHVRHSFILFFRKERIETQFWLVPEAASCAATAAGKPVPVRRERLTAQSARWVEQERTAIRDIAEDLSVAVSAIAIRRLNGQLASLAHTDALTQVNNRRAVSELLTRELEMADRYQIPLSVLLIDVDHFKRVNDTHGHEVGDRALVEVASTLRSHLRISDHIGRWGGEEFVVIAPHTNAEQAEIFANRLCSAVSAVPVKGIGRITVSIGVAERRPNQTGSELIACADKAMYKAKEQGRARAVRWAYKQSPN